MSDINKMVTLSLIKEDDDEEESVSSDLHDDIDKEIINHIVMNGEFSDESIDDLSATFNMSKDDMKKKCHDLFTKLAIVSFTLPSDVEEDEDDIEEGVSSALDGAAEAAVHGGELVFDAGAKAGSAIKTAIQNTNKPNVAGASPITLGTRG